MTLSDKDHRCIKLFGVKMILIKQFRSFFLTISLATVLATTIAFSFGSLNSLVATSQIQLATMNGVESMAKNIEGKAQEVIGNITGDPETQMMGKAKQVESRAQNAAEDVKDKMKSNERGKAVAQNIEGKVQEAKGKAKQAESRARNKVEDVKDGAKGFFN